MAKDGTIRGGNRAKFGYKSKPLADKILENSSHLNIIDLPEIDNLNAERLGAADSPAPKDYLLAKQKDGKKLYAERIYKETQNWLRVRKCDKLVNPQLIESYAINISRHIQCEEAITEFGLLAKHPTTGNAIASPFVSMSQSYMKQANIIWFQIFQIVRENCAVKYEGPTPQDDVMELLLMARRSKID
jgi:hypothetical protein